MWCTIQDVFLQDSTSFQGTGLRIWCNGCGQLLQGMEASSEVSVSGAENPPVALLSRKLIS